MRVSFNEKQEMLGVFLEELKDRNKLLDEYAHRPIEFLAKSGSYYPPVLRDMFMDIYTGRVTMAAIVGPRGGGKTYTIGDLAAVLFLFKGFDVLIGSGGENQSREVYDEVTKVLDVEECDDYVPSITTQITRGRDGNWIRFIPATTRRARGPHPGRGHGGVIILDEEGEMPPLVVKAILGTGSTADPLIIIRASTAHNVDGSFADLLEEYEKRGYTLYRWDAFDVCQRCRRKCETCIPEFRDDYCRGKAKHNSDLGWITLKYIFDMWQSETQEWFEVELMAMRPKRAGKVIRPEDIPPAIVDHLPYVPGCATVGGIDWGFKGMTAVVNTQMVGDGLHLFDRMDFTRKGTDEIIEALLEWKRMYGTTEYCADSSHPFENDALRKAGFTVHEITFVSMKEAFAGAVAWFFEKRRIKIAAVFEDVIKALKRWRRDASGKIVKKDDHYPDSLLCTMFKWWKKAKRKVGYMKVTRGR